MKAPKKIRSECSSQVYYAQEGEAELGSVLRRGPCFIRSTEIHSEKLGESEPCWTILLVESLNVCAVPSAFGTDSRGFRWHPGARHDRFSQDDIILINTFMLLHQL